MEESQVVNLLRHYRHDLSNDLQLIIGYAQMGKLEKVQEKVTELGDRLMQQQKFQNMPLPKTILTLLRTNYQNEQLKWEPVAELEGHIEVRDSVVAELINQTHQTILNHTMNFVLYHGTIKFQQLKSRPFVIEFELTQSLANINQLVKELLEIDERIRVNRADEQGLSVTWSAQ